MLAGCLMVVLLLMIPVQLANSEPADLKKLEKPQPRVDSVGQGKVVSGKRYYGMVAVD